ncbi:DNA-binding protein H-NS [Andreprevotia lacus DSM 23236]|jgi:DNA-binding protein H-NS|uniref:DNA-binding protein H-NS n=1 Tax=Andreprevotia lacus DSM 23236 TaxID=1121001 RepID=A0A1W1XUU6_9NEIS|nr:H-NS histone family protein [Andreprevotia lacus]SMC27729.1 DNA-binding protein H-NS [Andreprevotia lacus DSM 23236]
MADLSQYTLPELYALQKEVTAQIARKQVTDKHDTLLALRQLAQDRGFDLHELLGAAPAGKGNKPKTAGAAQYKNPADASQTWTGRGRKPQWVIDFLANGGELDTLKI